MKKLPYKEQEESEDKKKTKITFKPNKKVILIAIISGIILITSLFYFLVYKKPSNVLKRQLIKEDFNCKSKKCSKTINSAIYTVYYKEGTIVINDLKYQVTTSKNAINVLVKDNNQSCTYTHDDGVIGKDIDVSFTYTGKCTKYIQETNLLLGVYNEILISSKANISKFQK